MYENIFNNNRMSKRKIANKEEEKIHIGFDRGLDYKEIKDKMIIHLNVLNEKLDKIESPKKKKILQNQICYIIIALMQLRNGSRISEAVTAFLKYINDESNIDSKVIVKIAKSDAKKYNYKTKKMVVKKARFRKIMFPEDYIDLDLFYKIKDEKPRICNIPKTRICQRIRDYLLLHFKCNTHSLRYAFINFMLYDQKRNLADIAKYVGHTSVSQLVTYTQSKNCDQIFDLKI